MKRHIYLKMKTVEEARELFLSRFDLDGFLPPEEIATSEALGRVTAAPVFARLSSPHYHSAAMDGYAVAAEVTFGASQDKPKLLALGREAFPVNTGNALPQGTNAVIMVENVHPVDEDRSSRSRPRPIPGSMSGKWGRIWWPTRWCYRKRPRSIRTPWGPCWPPESPGCRCGVGPG